MFVWENCQIGKQVGIEYKSGDRTIPHTRYQLILQSRQSHWHKHPPKPTVHFLCSTPHYFPSVHHSWHLLTVLSYTLQLMKPFCWLKTVVFQLYLHLSQLWVDLIPFSGRWHTFLSIFILFHWLFQVTFLSNSFSVLSGNRTTKQVCSRVQKYFIKLHKAGLPIPGRAPKMPEVSKRVSTIIFKNLSTQIAVVIWVWKLQKSSWLVWPLWELYATVFFKEKNWVQMYNLGE